MNQEEAKPVVIDVGTGYTKAGVAGEEAPRVVMPSTVGDPKHEATMLGEESYLKEFYVGRDATNMRGVLKLKWPLERGIIEDFDSWEKLINFTYYNELGIHPDERPVLLTEAAFSPRKNRETMAEIMFETFDVPALYVETQALLSLYASGNTTGLVIDSGEGVTHIVPVNQSFLLRHAIKRMNIAGRDVNRKLGELLQSKGFYLDSSGGREIVRDIKEQLAYFALDYENELEKAKKTPKAIAEEYVLPDGQAVTLVDERFRAPEILYRPLMAGVERDSFSRIAYEALMDCDIDVRPQLYSTITISGGNTLIENFPERLEKEVKNLVPKRAREQVTVEALPDRQYAVWIGGAILASLPAFKDKMITKKEWKKEGPSTLFKRS
ncbi:MAG: actin family protein [Candidatus Korarchaeota archaeon]|nr:actin family protein [Candidatus Korarchaeota archaeon]NIU84995.1 actin, cytoplasmic 2 [Candidatus Thorarchaeota archaeon]NIW15017.1 actin, cytoplasmic 2 [Candidatus Thorarchaeota archaeon]NIW53027.1 actin, cytoplasmic 2 [Candidatus Korarchaeota archaeon]